MSDVPEIWKPVPGFVDVFASSLGYIKRRDFRHCRHHDRPEAPDKWIIGQGCVDGRGYAGLTLSSGLRTYKKHKVHRLVALAFIPNSEGLSDINHRNGIKTDNRPENLEWCTRGHNNRHAFSTGLRVMPKGENVGGAKLTEQQVRQIYDAVNVHNIPQREVGRQYGVSGSWVWNIAHGRFWKHLNLSGAGPA